MTRKASGYNRHLLVTNPEKPVYSRKMYDFTTKEGIIEAWRNEDITREEVIDHYRLYLNKRYGGLKPPKQE